MNPCFGSTRMESSILERIDQSLDSAHLASNTKWENLSVCIYDTLASVRHEITMQPPLILSPPSERQIHVMLYSDISNR